MTVQCYLFPTYQRRTALYQLAVITLFAFSQKEKSFESALATPSRQVRNFDFAKHKIILTFHLAHIQFYGGEENHVIISAGLDQTLKMFSPEHESGNRNLGKATLFHKSKKSEHQLSAITKFATSSNREAAWDNLVAIHHNGTRATTWSTKSLKR